MALIASLVSTGPGMAAGFAGAAAIGAAAEMAKAGLFKLIDRHIP
jgi:hypothetical protein